MIDATFIAVIVGFAALLFTVLWSERRQDRRFDRQDERFDRQDERFDRQDERFDRQDARIDERFDRQDAHFDRRFDRQDERFDRQDERFDRQDERLAAIEFGLVEVKTELKILHERVDMHDEQFDNLQRGMKSLGSKVDRMQGTLDVLVFGERGVPPPVARERAEAEERVGETVGD
jgi:chromosome segregation ATPase